MVDFKFKKEIELNGENWKLYVRHEQKNAIVLCPEYSVPYKSMNPVWVEIGVIVCGDKVRQVPESVVENQKNIMCYSLEDSNNRKEFSF